MPLTEEGPVVGTLCLSGLAVKRRPAEQGVLGSLPAFPELSGTRDFNTGSVVSTLLGTWHYTMGIWHDRVSARIGWPNAMWGYQVK